MKILRTAINEHFIEEDGLHVIRVLEGVHIDIETMKEDHRQSIAFTGGQKMFALYDSRNFFTITDEARSYVQSGITDQYRHATAVIANSPGMRLLVNFFIRFNKPKTPFRMFGDESSAREWLYALREKQAQESRDTAKT